MNHQLLDQFKLNVYKYGRPLEMSLFAYFFEEGSIDHVIEELKTFQNEDGGFGHGLEPDYTNPNSSPIQTWTAITHLRKLKLSSDHFMIKSILGYLESSYQKDVKRWPNTIPSNDQYPHAPWWTYRIDDSFNPSISLASFIMLHADPKDLVYTYAKEVMYEALIYLRLKKEHIEVHELRCFVDMANDLMILGDTPILTDALHTKLLTHMMSSISPDMSSWFTTYANKPSSLIKDYPSFGAHELKNQLLSEMELALMARDEEGAWNVTWDWQNTYREAFEVSKRTWRAIIVLEYAYLMHKLAMLTDENL